MVDKSVGTLKLADGSVTTAIIQAGAIEAEHIKPGEVAAIHLADNSVATSRIIDGQVTMRKLGPPNYAISSAASFDNPAPAFASVAGLTATITTLGRPVRIMLIPKSTSATTPGLVAASRTNTNDSTKVWTRIRFLQNGNPVDVVQFGLTAKDIVALPTVLAAEDRGIDFPPSAISTLFTGAPGTYTFTVQVMGSDNVVLQNVALFVCEM